MEGPWPLGFCSSYPHTELFSPSEATYTLNSSLPTSQSLTDFHTTTTKNYHPTTTVRQQKATPSSPHFHLFAAITTDTQHLLNALVQIKSMRTEFTDHYKQDFTLLALISIYKAKKKIKNTSHTSLSLRIPHTPTSHFQSTFSSSFSLFHSSLLAEDLRRIFPYLGPRKEILNPPCISFSFICISNVGMKYWIHPASPILELKQEHIRLNFRRP